MYTDPTKPFRAILHRVKFDSDIDSQTVVYKHQGIGSSYVLVNDRYGVWRESDPLPEFKTINPFLGL